MPGTNISRAESTERAQHLRVESYDISLDLSTAATDAKTFTSTSVIKFSCTTPGYNTFIDAVAESIISASLNGTPVDTSSYDGTTVHLQNLQAENELVISMNALYSTSGEGLVRSVDPVDNEVYLYSQGETAYIRKMYAGFDQPSLKAEFTFHVKAPSKWEVISNYSPANKESAGDFVTWNFKTTPRISSYATAVVAGPYAAVRDVYKGTKEIPMAIYCRKSLSEHLDSDEIFALTRQGFDYFEKVFGLTYPFEKYDQIAVVDFNWGAMENIGAVTFKEDLFVFRSKVTEKMYLARANTILHEMAHMWFGNMVTMSWWDDLWLNESFAEWSSYLALAEGTRFKGAWTEFNSARKNWGYRQDQMITTHPIVADMVDIAAVNANFDGISYAKGASVLHQLTAYVGRENFIKALQTYFKKHAFKNTTLNDLLVELEATSGRDLKPWVATWLQTAGVNTLRPVVTTEGDHYTSVIIKQDAPLVPSGSREMRIHRLAIGLYDIADEKLVLRKRIQADVEGSETKIAELAGEKTADVLLVNDADMTYAKVRFDEHSINTLTRNMVGFEDELSRAVVWGALWDMLRDAELSATEFVTIVANRIATETDISMATILGNQLRGAIDNYAPQMKRASLRDQSAHLVGQAMDAADPGSDAQLNLARLFAALAENPSQVHRIRELLDGALPGLNIDADLRWVFVRELAERGVLDHAAIDEELERDKTLSGELNHTAAYASIPDAKVKAEIWNSIINDDLSTSIRRYKVSGFISYRHPELMDQYVAKYHSVLNSVWNPDSYEKSKAVVESLYPMYVGTKSTLEASDTWLNGEGKDSPETLRRLVKEGRDSLERALRVQAREN